MLKVIELFAGLGSQTQALKNIGAEHTVTAVSEIDRFALVSYEALHGAPNNLGDITRIAELPAADLWTYSFPCQDISLAGKQAGIIRDGTRSGLLYEVERLLRIAAGNGTLPKYLLLENVKPLVGARFKPDFDKWLYFLSGLGYTNYWQVLNSRDYCIPQNRERVFCVSIRGEHEPFRFPDKRILRLRLKDMLDAEVDKKYYLSDKAISTLLNSTFNQEKFRIQDPDGVHRTMCARDHKSPTVVPSCIKAGSSRITAEETRAKAAEQTNSNAIAAEKTRAQAAEDGLTAGIAAEKTRAQAAEQGNASDLAAEVSRAKTAEAALAQSILENAQVSQSDWNANDVNSVAYIKNKPASLPASDVYAWAKTASKPNYTPSEIGAEPAFSKNNAFNKTFGTASGTVCQGNDSRLSNARTPSAHTHGNSDLTGIAAWAKAASKPTYTPSEVGAEPTFNKNTAFNKSFGTASGTVCQGNDSRLSDARPPTTHTHRNVDLTEIAAWAKAASKPTYTCSEVGAEPAFGKNSAFNKNFGTASGTVCQGNDSRLSNARTPTTHASTGTTYGVGDTSNYGHVKLSSVDGGTATVSGDGALRYHYSTVPADINLNNYSYEGRFTLYNPPTTITDAVNNFPPGWNTGSQNANTAYLEVRRFYGSTAIHQTLYKRATVQRWVRVGTSATNWTAWKEIDNAAIPNPVPATRTVNGKALTGNITLVGGDIGITSNSYLGGATTVQAALNYIANVFAGSQRVTKLVANNFDT